MIESFTNDLLNTSVSFLKGVDRNNQNAVWPRWIWGHNKTNDSVDNKLVQEALEENPDESSEDEDDEEHFMKVIEAKRIRNEKLKKQEEHEKGKDTEKKSSAESNSKKNSTDSREEPPNHNDNRNMFKQLEEHPEKLNPSVHKETVSPSKQNNIF